MAEPVPPVHTISIEWIDGRTEEYEFGGYVDRGIFVEDGLLTLAYAAVLDRPEHVGSFPIIHIRKWEILSGEG